MDKNDWNTRPIEDKLRGEVIATKEALRELLDVIPFDVLRMKAGNAFLDMEKVDRVRTKADSIANEKGEG